jgi:hypothetical protein
MDALAFMTLEKTPKNALVTMEKGLTHRQRY